MHINLLRLKIIAVLVILFAGIALAIPTLVSAQSGCGTPGPTSCNAGNVGQTCYRHNPNPSCPGYPSNNAYTAGTCVYDIANSRYTCSISGGTNPPPSCTPTSPGPVSLVSPANGSLLPSNETGLRWAPVGSWGNGCGSTGTFRLDYQVNVNGNCTAAWITENNIPFNQTQRALNNLQWDTEYCWRVRRFNGRIQTVSPIWRFRTGTAPTVGNGFFTASTINKCSTGASLSGRLNGNANDANINNPITYNLEVSSDEGVASIEEVRIAFVSDSYVNSLANAYRPVNGSSNYLYIEHITPRLHDTTNLENIGFRVRNLDSGGTFSSVNNSTTPYFGNGATSGDLTVGTGIARLKDIGGNTQVTQLNANTYRVSFQIEFLNSYNSTNLGVYGAVIKQTSDGVQVTQSPFPGSSTVYDGDLVLEKFDSWGVDMRSPAVNISDASFLGTDQFSLTWDIQDNLGMNDVRSYCYFSSGNNTATLRDQTLNRNIQLNSTPKGFPDPDYCLVNTPGVHNRNYNVTSGELRGFIALEVYAQDNACNVTEAPRSIRVPTPWFMTADGPISALGGYENIAVPSSTVNLGDIGLNLSNRSFLSTYLAIAGGGSGADPVARRSQQSTHTLDYGNQATLPLDYGYSDWYSFMYDVVDAGSNITTQNPGAIGGNLSSNFGVSPGANYNAIYQGNLNVNSGLVCDVDSVIFVTGNLRISPDVRHTNQGGCIFVVQGNTNVGGGTFKSSGLPLGGTARHDVVEAMLVTNGTLTLEADDRPANEVRDALLIKGSVFANTLVLDRDLGLRQNSGQPAELIQYDPYYLFNFRNLINASEFSLREF